MQIIKFDAVSFMLNPFVLMFVTIALGLLFGKLKFGKFSFGTSGALFVGLAVGWGVYGFAQKIYKLYPIKWTHLFHNFLLFGHRFFIGIPINWTYFLFKTLFLGHTFACVSSIIGLHTEVIQMTNYHCPTRFTPEQMKVLSANPFTYKVSAIYIHYTLEFKNLFLAHYEAGEPVKDIFAAFGYDPAILGDNRMYAFARRISKQAKEGKVPTEDSSSVKIQKPAKVDYNTLPAQQSVSAMQREIAYLRQQIEFLKKITELDNDRKPRT